MSRISPPCKGREDEPSEENPVKGNLVFPEDKDWLMFVAWEALSNLGVNPADTSFRNSRIIGKFHIPLNWF